MKAELQFIEYRSQIESIKYRIAASIESTNFGSKADLLDIEDAKLSLQRLESRNRRSIDDTVLRLRRLVGLDSTTNLTILPAEQPIDVDIVIDIGRAGLVCEMTNCDDYERSRCQHSRSISPAPRSSSDAGLFCLRYLRRRTQRGHGFDGASDFFSID